jgi:hypothetical protein
MSVIHSQDHRAVRADFYFIQGRTVLFYPAEEIQVKFQQFADDGDIAEIVPDNTRLPP